MNKLNIVTSYFQGAFDALMESKSEEYENTALAAAYELTNKNFQKQPIFKSTLKEFETWYYELINS